MCWSPEARVTWWSSNPTSWTRTGSSAPSRKPGPISARWRGPALADCADIPFARAEAARLEELRSAAIEDRIEAELELGRHSDLVAELEALVAQYPLRERLRAQLMVALYRSGR